MKGCSLHGQLFIFDGSTRHLRCRVNCKIPFEAASQLRTIVASGANKLASRDGAMSNPKKDWQVKICDYLKHFKVKIDVDKLPSYSELVDEISHKILQDEPPALDPRTIAAWILCKRRPQDKSIDDFAKLLRSAGYHEQPTAIAEDLSRLRDAAFSSDFSKSSASNTRTKIVGLLIPCETRRESRSRFWTKFEDTISETCNPPESLYLGDVSYWTLSFHHQESVILGIQQLEAIYKLRDRLFGLIIAPAFSDEYGAHAEERSDLVAAEDLIRKISLEIPTLVVDRDMNFIDHSINLKYIGPSNELMAFACTDYLIKKNHRIIGGIFEDRFIKSTGDRYTGFVDALTKNNIPLRKGITIDLPGTLKKNWGDLVSRAEEVVRFVIEEKEEEVKFPIGMVCATTFQVEALLQAIENQNIVRTSQNNSPIVVPDDISIVCCDNSIELPNLTPPITSSRYSPIEIAKFSYNALKKIAGGISDNAFDAYVHNSRAELNFESIVERKSVISL